MGRRWDTSRPNFFAAPEGLSLYDIVKQSIDNAYKDKVYNKAQYVVLSKYARVRLNGVEKDRQFWKIIFPQKGDRIEILHGVRGGGGGGGKNPLGTILSVIVVAVAMVATSWAGGTGVFAAGGLLQGMGLGLTGGALFAAQVGIGLATIGALMAINALFPSKPPSIGGLGGESSAEKTSPTYSISGGKNAHNVDGYVPLVLGRHRQTPPLGAKSWTSWHGEDQYFNMLVVWGHCDVEVSDFKIGDTALSKYADVTHHFIQSTTGKGLKYFGKQYNEESVGATLKKEDGWVVRTVGEANELSIDIAFPGGLTTINQKNGNKESRSVNIEIQYKPTSGGSWKGFATKTELKFGETKLTWSQNDINNMVSVFYKDGKLSAVPRGQIVSGGIQIFPASGIQYIYGCGVSVEPSGDRIKITVKGGVFKKGNKVYGVGGATTRYSAYFYYEEVNSGRGNYYSGKDTVLYIDSPIVIGVNSSGKVVKGAGIARLYPTRASGVSGGSVSWSRQYQYYYNYYDTDEWGYPRSSTTYTNWQATVKGGSVNVPSSGKATIRAAVQKQVVRNYIQSGLPLKSYDVRIRRTTADTNDSYIIDECQWATMRAIIDKPAFETPVPICVSELRIRASEQLSGYVSDFSGLCWSKIPDWTPQTTKKVNGKTVTVPGHWNTWRTTSNPASILRYLLTSKHSLIKPFPASRLDNDAIVKLWNWCRKNDYRFDFIADSEENLWSRLIQVLSPAMAGPTTDVDGLWGAIIDSPDKTIRQLFTPRNSWGMSIQRGFAKLPDALRVKFVDETDDWQQKEGFVYNDGFNKDGSGGKKKANDVVEWAFEGVTNWNRMYKLARYHLAQMLHRQMTVTINTDWEWLAVHRGDLVGLSSDVLMNTFGTARVMRKAYATSGKVDDAGNAFIYEDDIKYIDKDTAIELFGPSESVPSGAKLVGIEIDDTVYYTSPKPARYGIAVRSGTGKVNIIEIRPEYGEENSILYFANPGSVKTAPAFGDLISVSLLGEEYEEYLVSSVTPGDNMSAQLTLIPYKTKEIMAAANSKIPAYEAPVVLDMVKGAADIPAPVITSVVSDERVAMLSASGAVTICIGVAFKLSPTKENTSGWMVHINATNVSTNAVATGSTTINETYVVAQNVKEGQSYYVKIRISDPTTGRYSPWSGIVTHKVTGLVAPPPAPDKAYAAAYYPQGIRLYWDEVNVIDLRRYKITGSTTGQTRGKETEYVYSPKSQTGKLTYNVFAVDTTDHVSTKSATATITVNPPKKPVVTLARLENEGVVVTYEDAYATWPVTQYEWTCGAKTATSAGLRAVVAPSGNINALKVKGRARDYFLNWGEWCSEVPVELVPPATPNVSARGSELGMVLFSWQNCQTVTNIDRYVVSIFVSSNPMTNFSGTPLRKTSTNALFVNLDISTIHDDNGDNQFYVYAVVQAVDKWGLESGKGTCSFLVVPPEIPVISVEKRTDGLYLKWQDCKTAFNIKKYIVYDKSFDTTYEIDGTSHPMKPRAAAKDPYEFYVQALDVAGLWSPEQGVAYFTVTGVAAIHGSPDPEHPEILPALSVKIDGSDILLEWNVPDSSWPIDYYQIYNAAGVSLGIAKTTFFRFPAGVAGAYEYGVRAKDIAGNWGPMGRRADITINPPALPVIKDIALTGDGLSVSWGSGGGDNTLPIVAWDVQHWWSYDDDGDGVASTCHWDHGRMDVDHLTILTDSTGRLADSQKTVPALPVGTHYVQIRAVDSAGNLSEELDGQTGLPVYWAEASIDVAPPGKVAFQNCVCIDNNIMLYWTQPDKVYFPIAYYLFEEIERYEVNGTTEEYAMEIGRIDALFASSFESAAGLYRYGITPVDAAGNRGKRTVIAMQVSQPPDFILYHNYDSLFNGSKTKFILDGEGHMIGPFDDATWNANLAAMASMKGVNAEDITWQEKVNWGWEHWLDPAGAEAVYVEIVDVTGHENVFIPSTTINVTIDSITLAGEPSFACKIEVSQDGLAWQTLSEDAFMVHGGEFRFVRYTITLTGGTAEISNINYRLDVKRKSDFGQITSYAVDTTIDGVLYKANGDDYENDIDTPMEKGTWVPFNVDFADVESLPKPNVINHPEYTAYTVFEDVLQPAGFRVFVLDQNGNRVTADVDWSAFGV